MPRCLSVKKKNYTKGMFITQVMHFLHIFQCRDLQKHSIVPANWLHHVDNLKWKTNLN